MAQTSRGSPEAKIWSVYVSEADRQDRSLAESWKGDMDALLIFAGLFSASITAFLIESYKTLTPDPTIAVLAQISVQLTALGNGTPPPIVPPDFLSPQPSYASLLCNTFWFLSLAFSLTCALTATLVDQWARNYLNATQTHQAAPQIRARIRAYLYQGLQRFGMTTVVETIPTLLHISLFLFFAGLIAFLFPINSVMCNLSIAILVVCTALYTVVTLLPLLYHHCPYQTPFSSLCWWAYRAIWNVGCCYRGPSRHLTIAKAREVTATETSPARDARDEDALRHTLESFSDNSELAAFVEGIPGFLLERDASAIVMRRFLNEKHIDLGSRIIRQLHLSGYEDTPEKLRRAITCLAAIWSLLAHCWNPEIPESEVEDWFDDEALPVLETFEYEGPLVGHYLSSTVALFSMTLLDSYFRSAISIEHELTQLGVEHPWTTSEPWHEQLRVQKYLSGGTPEVNSGCIMGMKTWLHRLRRDFTAIKAELISQPSHPSPSIDNFIQSLWSFQTLVNEARITVLYNFMLKLLSDYPPYEALPTFYHLIMDSDLGLRVSQHNQACLLDLLKGYDELPQLAMDHLLNMVSILDEQEYIDEAQHVVSEYLRSWPESTSASRALLVLQSGGSSPPAASILNIFSWHQDKNLSD